MLIDSQSFGEETQEKDKAKTTKSTVTDTTAKSSAFSSDAEPFYTVRVAFPIIGACKRLHANRIMP